MGDSSSRLWPHLRLIYMVHGVSSWLRPIDFDFLISSPAEMLDGHGLDDLHE